MADKHEKSVPKEAEKKGPAPGSQHAKKEHAVTAKEVRGTLFCLFGVCVILLTLALFFGGQAFQIEKTAREKVENHMKHADIEVLIQNAQAFTAVKKNGEEIILEEHIAKAIEKKGELQRKEANTSISGAISSSVHRIITEESANPSINSYTNKAVDSTLSFEVNGQADNKYVSFSTQSNDSKNPNLVLLRNNDAFVGVGTTDPRMTLDVNGDVLSKTLSAAALNVKNVGLTKKVFTVTSEGKVGISNENPTKTLQVSGDVTTDSLVLKSVSVMDSMTCSDEGKMIYYKPTQKVMLCDGSNWVDL